MNIVELIKKSDSVVRVERLLNDLTWGGVEDPNQYFSKQVIKHVKKRFFGFLKRDSEVVLRGLSLIENTRVVVSDASRYWPDFAAGKGEFQFKSIGCKSAEVSVFWEINGIPINGGSYDVTQEIRTICIPATAADANLVITIKNAPSGQVFFGVHEILDRKPLYQLCNGTGFELGPGSKPQILPSLKVNVSYLEQATPEDWQRLYGGDAKIEVDKSLWKYYVVGEAHSIPASHDSLDFIFSSHVLEHLANPLGHLKYWATLLRSNGVVVAIIPDAKSCKDYVFDLSTKEELEQELLDGDMNPNFNHYKRWAKFRMRGTDPKELLESKRSIHVHFYTPSSLREIIRHNYKRLGYASFELIFRANHKDFYIILRK